MVVLADAFPYIWHKRLLAGEMMRAAAADGLIVMPHLHSSLGENFSAGDTLTPAAYRDLFAPLEPRLFSDTRLRNEFLDRRIVDLSSDLSADDLGNEPSFSLVVQASGSGPRASGGTQASGFGLPASGGTQASGSKLPASGDGTGVFRRYSVGTDVGAPTGELVVNPLYRIERRGTESVLTLEFPTPEYAEEFAECLRYLPESLTLEGDLSGPLTRDALGSRYEELLLRRIVIDGPAGYC
jgi:hypothetical protein